MSLISISVQQFNQYLDYGITLWGATHKMYANNINVIKKAIRLIKGVQYNEYTEPLFNKLSVQVEKMYMLSIAKLMYSSYLEDSLPEKLKSLLTNNSDAHY